MPADSGRPGHHGSDAQLLERFRAGERDAVDVLFDRFADRVLALAVHLTESREDAEEVAQEAFLRAFRHARSFRSEAPGSLGPWLYAIVRRLASDRRRQLRLPALSLSAPEAEGIADNMPSVAETAERRAERAALLRAMDELPEEWRIVLILCDLEEVPHAEAAVALDRSLAATKSLLYRARRALRDRMRELWTDE